MFTICQGVSIHKSTIFVPHPKINTFAFCAGSTRASNEDFWNELSDCRYRPLSQLYPKFYKEFSFKSDVQNVYSVGPEK